MNNIDYIKKYSKTEDLENNLKRLENNEPPQYILGVVDFYGYNFRINKNVLIPRFETETLVEKTINYIKKYQFNNPNILDIGTGSGAIAITLKKEITCEVTASDISEKALEVANENSKLNNVIIKTIKSDVFENISAKFDVIISNPPYIGELEEVESIVKNNEPHIALYAKNNGLEIYEKILSKSKDYLNKKSILAFEIGHKQGNFLSTLARKIFPIGIITIEKDLTGKDRYLFIINNNE